MKNLNPLFASMLMILAVSCKNEKTEYKTEDSIAKSELTKEVNTSVSVIPIKHGTLILETDTEVIYVDPTGGLEAFKNQKSPTLVLITDIHGDHLNIETLEALNLDNTTLVAPQAVMEKIPEEINSTPITLNNGEKHDYNGIIIEAIPMYNLREEALKFHPKGRGNGYVLTVGSERIYISGDTEDITEMRNLEHIDKAFVCMNLPYTMPVESAADAVLDFKPKTVYPYHYRGTDGLSDVEKFKSLVISKNDSINVKLLEWY